MSSIEDDEQDDNNIFDQLKSIKPFTLDQLYLLHPDVSCPSKKTADYYQSPESNSYHDQNLYQNLVEYEQLRNKLKKLASQVKQLRTKTFDHIDQVWILNEESPRKIGMCQQGKIAETTFKYKKANINKKQLDVLETSFSELSEVISKDYIYYSFESQIKRHKIATQFSISYQIQDQEERKSKLKSSINTLVDFIKHLGDSRTDFVLQCRKWLLALSSRFLEHQTTDDYKFIMTQISRGPAGIADWSAELIECKPYDQVSTFYESAPQYITHCTALLTELFNSLQHKIRRVTILSGDVNAQTSSSTNSECLPDQNWSLIDPRFSCSEELNVSLNSGNTLTESDVIKLCLKIPVAQIFRAYVKKCLEFSDFNPETDKNYEFIMLKLLTIGTIIIKTYQIGLETFNSIQYGNLIEYLSYQVRRTVIVLSDQWSEFRRRLKGVDHALLMRLQVEYDNFMLRSILIILELRQSGIWRHLSRAEQDITQVNHDTQSWSTDSIRPALTKLLQVTGLSSTATSDMPSSQADNHNENSEQGLSLASSSSAALSESSLTYEFSIEWFKEVSEPMLWHILWQFYHNAFVNSCSYHSDNYWLEKFREKSVVYLFVNKIRDSSMGECSYLLNSIASMLLSRTRHDSKLVSFIATEIFNLSYKQEELRDKIAEKGTKALIRCASRFPNLISLFISFMVNEEVSVEVINLFKGCSLCGWICNDEEIGVISQWLIEYSIDSTHNKVARLIMTKLLLNSPEFRTEGVIQTQDGEDASKMFQTSGRRSFEQCFIDLKTRRRFALLLYEVSKKHLPDRNDFGPQSLGALIEVAFGGIFCEKSSTLQSTLFDLAVDSTYQQLYVWLWRLLFTLRLHILNQPETDWNDVQSKSGISRSIKNTVIVDDFFYPVPSVQDSECLSLSEGIKDHNPVALYIYLLMTDVTWQAGNLDSCLSLLNIMANSNHITPSLTAMKCLTICHLNDLSETMVKDPRCLEYFTTVVTSNFDVTRFASLLITQMQRLKQYRQLQLSQFYITILLEVANVVVKQQSSSWFSSDGINLDKVACLLDYIVRFNFPTQRLEIIHNFNVCSYSIQGFKATSSWFGSLFATNSINTNSTKRELSTILHILTQKFKKYTWLRWVTTECDTLRLEKIWEDLVVYLGKSNEDANLDSAIKKVCPQINSSILKSNLPIYSWLNQIFDIVESDLSHPLCPLIWYNFFLNYFANSLNGPSVGSKLIPQETLVKLMTRLDSLFNYHLYKHRNWSSASTLQQNSLAQLYKAYRLWLQDSSLQDAYVDIDRLREDYLVPVLKAVMESSTEGACLQYINLENIEIQNKNLCQVWSTATRLERDQSIKKLVFANNNHDKSMVEIMGVDDEASDAVSLIVKHNKVLPQEQNKLLVDGREELKKSSIDGLLANDPKYRPIDEMIELVKKDFRIVFEESMVFGSNITAVNNIKSEIIDLIQELYSNKKREVIRVVPCAEGSECPGPARIKFEIEEATIDDRKSECIQDRQRQCEELVAEILIMPSSRTIHSTIMIEDNVKYLVDDRSRAKVVITSFLNWIKTPENYNQLNGSYYAANHLLKILLEILSHSDEADTYNTALIDVCLVHPGSVQVLSPFLSPSSCSLGCFLELYKKISTNHSVLGPTAMFVILSKFDISSWLKNIDQDKKMHHDLIRTTCSGLREMGKDPDDSFILTFDLYKRHIQVELAPPYRRKPEEISLVLVQFLTIMDEQMLAPSLWTEFMSILGLEKRIHLGIDMDVASTSILDKSNAKSNTSTVLISPMTSNLEDYLEGSSVLNNVAEDIAMFADSQTIFGYKALDDWINITSEFVNNKCSQINITLLEFYEDYLDQFSIVVISISYMWLRSVSEHYPDNHELNWKKLMSLWYNWIYLSKNCQNVGKTSYCLIASQYVAVLRYMINKMPENSELVLQSVLSSLADYVSTTKEVVYLELTILQRCLKKLPWSSLIFQPKDYDNLAKLSEQKNYNISDLISHILLHANIKESLTKIHQDDPTILPHVVERLATTTIIQSNYLKGYRLQGAFFSLIPIDQIVRLAELILSRMEFVNLEHSQNNKLLVNLLRFMCIKLDSSNDIEFSSQSNNNAADILDRSIIYSKFVSDYLIGLIKNHPTVVKHNKPYIYAIMDNTLQDLKILLSPDIDITRKTLIYMNLLNCCSSGTIDEESRLLIAKSLLKSSMLKDRPIVAMEIFYAIGQVIGDGRVLVFIIEKMIRLYLNMNGHYEKVWKSFSLNVLPNDVYLNACIESNAPLALLVYFESLTRNGIESGQHTVNNVVNSSEPVINVEKIWSSFFHWISKLSVITYVGSSNELKSNDTRLSIAWIRLLDLLEQNLSQIMRCSGKSGVSKSTSTLEPTQDDVTSETSSSRGSIATQQQDYKELIIDQPSRMSLIHKSLIDFLKQLLSLYDSCNSGGLWSYLKPTRTEQTARASIIALAVACFLSDRALSCLKNPSSLSAGDDDGNFSNEDETRTKSLEQWQSSLPAHLKSVQEEISKIKRSCLVKLEVSRKSKYYLDNAHFIEALIESVNRNDKVQYCEGVQLITNFVKSLYSTTSADDYASMNKILPSFKD